MPQTDELLLDDLDALSAADPGEMLPATATAGAQLRRGLAGIDEAAMARASADGRPRGLVVAGMGGSGISGDVLAAVAGAGCPIPLQVVKSHTLPGWVGPLDVVVAVSCSGTTQETLSLAAEATRRGARVVGIGSAGSPLEQLVESGGGVYLTVDALGLMPRAALWTLATPLLLLGAALDVVSLGPGVLQAAADALDEVSTASGPVVLVADNRAKTLGLALAESLPVVWGTSPVAAVAAYRAACQLNENAKLPCTFGGFSEVNHNQVVAFDGPYGVRAPVDDVFRDPIEDGSPMPRLRLVMLRDAEEHPQDVQRADASIALADERSIPVDVVTARAGHPLVRLASLVGLVDWVSVYAALALGIDPSPIGPIIELKDRITD
ncbi:MAG: SIS domain-containing protein [Candidatus Nanopelagicales bacterium]